MSEIISKKDLLLNRLLLPMLSELTLYLKNQVN